MRTIDKKPTKKELWDMLGGIFESNPNIASIDSHEDATGVHMRLVLKKPTYDYEYNCKQVKDVKR